MKIRLHPEDSARYGVDEVFEFDETRIGLREITVLKKATGYGHEDLGKAFSADEPDLEALAALVWLAIGRATGTRPDWGTFDVALIDIEEDKQATGKAPAKTSKPKSGAGRQRSRTTTASARGSSTS